MNNQQRVQQAMALHKAGKLAEAEPLYDAALREQPKLYPALHLMGLLKQQQGKLDEALALMERALKVQPGAPDTLINYGLSLQAADRPEEALVALDQAVKLRPDNAGAWNNRGILQARLDRLVEALASYDKALALVPGYAEAHCNRAIALSRVGRDDDALAALERAIALKPDFTRALDLRGRLQELGARREEALTSFNQALAAGAGPDTLAARGQTLLMMNRIEEGFADFRRIAALAPQPTQPQTPHQQRHDREQQDYLRRAPLGDGARLPGAAISQTGQNEASEQWRTAAPKIAVVDGLLTPQALEALRRFCLSAPVWRRVYEAGYLGARPEDGFACPLLAQIAEELRAVFPTIFRGHPLRYVWAFKYDSQMRGIDIHGDDAAVNVNFWITPDEANRDPQKGGLVVWDKAAPPDWDFAKMNGDLTAIRDFLAANGARARTIPYRANRAVIFDSDLFHETDKINFEDGYENRRINVTMLFGRREDLA